MESIFTRVLICLSFIFLNPYWICAQVDKSLLGIADKSFIKVESQPVGTYPILDYDFITNERVRTLAFSPSDCRFYGIIDSPTTPTLIWFDYSGNYDVVGRLTLGGLPLPMCEALAFHSVDQSMYAAVSIEGNPSNQDFFSESIVRVDLNSAECTFISRTNRDIDAMEFVGETLYTSDTGNDFTVISKVSFQNIPLSVNLEPIISLDEEVAIIDLTNHDGSQLIYCTSGHNLHSIDLAVQPVSLQELGTTHLESQYNGKRLFGLASATYISSDFTMSHSGNSVSFLPTQAFNPAFSYFWDFGDGNASSSHSPVHNFAEANVHEICLTARYQECISISCTNLTILPTSSQNVDHEEATLLKLRPNPTQDFLGIELQSNKEKISSISVFNMLGSLIDRRPGLNTSTFQLNVSDLPSGGYFVLINGRYSKQFIKD